MAKYKITGLPKAQKGRAAGTGACPKGWIWNSKLKMCVQKNYNNPYVITDPDEYNRRVDAYIDSSILYNTYSKMKNLSADSWQDKKPLTDKLGKAQLVNLNPVANIGALRAINKSTSFSNHYIDPKAIGKIKPINTIKINTYAPANPSGRQPWRVNEYMAPQQFFIYKKLPEGSEEPEFTSTIPEIGRLPVKTISQPETPEFIQRNLIPKPINYDPIRTAKRLQTVMEPDPNKPGEYKIKDFKQVPYSAYFPGEGWQPMDAPGVAWINEKGEEVYEDPTRNKKNGGLTKAQEGIITQPELTYDAPETFAYATPAAEKKHKQLMDKARALMTTVRGREAWYQDVKPKDFTNKELSRFIQGAEDYRKQAEEFERARRKVKEDKISTSDFARMYEERNWSRFDPYVMREGYKGQFQDAVDEANARKAKNMAVTETALELTGAPALVRVVENPIETAKGVGQTVGDLATLPFGLGEGIYNYATKDDFDMGVNPLTGSNYGEGLNETLDAVSVLPFAKATGLIDDLARASRYVTNKLPLRNVPRVQTTTNPINTFKSEIDWSKWNPDTPKYPELINEYNAIEEATKANGTWMKNPDGSPFQGTPEQFIQQQSSYFKKAFPNILRDSKGNVLPVKHGSPNKFEEFKKDYFGSTTDMGDKGVGTYVTPLDFAKEYGDNVYELAVNSKNPLYASNFIPDNIPLSARQRLADSQLKWFHRDIPPKLEGRVNRFLDNDLVIGDEFYPKINENSFEIVVPYSNRMKSLRGNVGFFDMNDPNIYRTIDFEDAGFLVPEKSYFTPNTDFEKEIANQAEEYFRLKTSPENIQRAKALDAEYGTNYMQALQDLITQKQSQGVAEKYPFKIGVENNPGEGGGGYSALTSEGIAKRNLGQPTTIDDRKIVIYGDSPIEDIRRRVQHEMSHHTILGQNNLAAFNNAWGKKLQNALEAPGEVSKINPQLADDLMQPAFPKMENSPTLYEYISDPVEIDAYLNTSFRDKLVEMNILKNHWENITEDKLAQYFMDRKPKDKIVKTLLDIIKPEEFLEIFNKGIYAVPALVGIDALSQKEYKDGGISMYLSPEEIDRYKADGYTVVYE